MRLGQTVRFTGKARLGLVPGNTYNVAFLDKHHCGLKCGNKIVGVCYSEVKKYTEIDIMLDDLFENCAP